MQISNISNLLAIINRLDDSGNTDIVIEHNLDENKTADRIIDMEPLGGNKASKIIFAGTPKQFLSASLSFTNNYLGSII